MKLLGLCVVFVVAIGGSPAHAEKVKANQPAKLLNHPGEHGKVLLKIKEGQSMTVLAKEGRWVKVRVLGRTGFVPRSKLDMADEGALVRNTRRRPFVDGRSTQRGFGSQEAPDDRIGADATEPSSSSEEEDGRKSSRANDNSDDADSGEAVSKRKPKPSDDEGSDGLAKSPRSKDDTTTRKTSPSERDGDDGDGGNASAAEPERPTAHVRAKTKIFSERDKSSEVAFTAKPSETLYPTDSKGTWTLVESVDGDVGWVPTESLAVAEDSQPTGSRRRLIEVKAGLGVAFIQQSMRTAGTTLTGADQVPDVYNIGTAAAAVDLGGRVLFPMGTKFLVGGELLFGAAKTLFGGVSYKSTTTSLTVSDFNARAVLAYPTHVLGGMQLLARLGFRYRSYAVDDYGDVMKNPAKIPQEILKAPTLGVGMVFPKLTERLGLELGIDTILFGASVTQTAGLEDGATPGMKSVRLTVGAVYHWKNTLDLQGMYGLDYASYEFGTPNTGAAMQSTRGHTGTDVSRTDMIHTVSFGVAKGF